MTSVVVRFRLWWNQRPSDKDFLFTRAKVKGTITSTGYSRLRCADTPGGSVSRIWHVLDTDTARIHIQGVLENLDTYRPGYEYQIRMGRFGYDPWNENGPTYLPAPTLPRLTYSLPCTLAVEWRRIPTRTSTETCLAATATGGRAACSRRRAEDALSKIPAPCRLQPCAIIESTGGGIALQTRSRSKRPAASQRQVRCP
jgi:hypothetical protein